MPSLKIIISTYTDPIINPRSGAIATSWGSPTLVAGVIIIAVSMFMVESKLEGIK